MLKTSINIPTNSNTPRLIFRTRKTGDVILCDYCQNYKCNWLDYTPLNYPKNCPGTREFWIADGKGSDDGLLRRRRISQQIGFYTPFDRTWHLDAMKTKSLSADALMKLLDEVNTWSARNKFCLCKMVEYEPGSDIRSTTQVKLSRNKNDK